MEPAYEPKKYEKEIYKIWQESGFFNPDNLPQTNAEKDADKRRRLRKSAPAPLDAKISNGVNQRQSVFTIAMPPPNVTGSLHMGHALNNTIQDILIRFYRMNGYQALWLPGTDHAGIATQNVVEKKLKKEGLRRHDLGREKFVERVWQWVEKYGHLIIEQLKKIGCSCDWSRQKFTLDKKYSEAVYTAFIHYYKKGLIYRGPRIVNWCPRCETAISDIEVKYQQQVGKLWFIKYPLASRINADMNADQRGSISDNQRFDQRESAFVVVATTRPETMLGDTAVAVNPKDSRYKNLIGQKVILPLINREIPIIAHHLVDLEFGTGAVKVTPAHDATDWQIGKEKGLEVINVIGSDGRMTKEAGEFAGLTTLEAREKILAKLKNQNLLEKEEDYTYNLALCERCHTPIEPQISTQWFLKMKELAKPAIEVVKKGKIKIIPERYKKIYLDWLSRVEDWCISRQLWWGHQIPVWHCQQTQINADQNADQRGSISANQRGNLRQSANDNFIVSVERPKQCPFCKSCQMEQSADVLDTWFSSALWPFATLGWPASAKASAGKPNKTNDLKEYYPTEFLSTAQDILYLWVARMVFSSLEFTGKIPFKNVYIHPTVLAISGKRMSKSLGTGIDPLEIAEKYGADAVRMGLMYQMNREQQAFKFDERAVLASRNFVNKLWNISRFVEISTKQNPNSKIQMSNKFQNPNVKTLALPDKWILSRLNTIISSTSEKIETYQFGEATREIYDFVWHEFADWYLEIAKLQISDLRLKENTSDILYNSLFIILKLLHPFIPFVTEQIWQQICSPTNYESKRITNLLMVESWPKTEKKLINKKAEQEFEKIKNLIIEIRNWRKEKNIQPKDIVDYKIKKSEEIFSENKEIIEKLARIKLVF